MLQIYYRGDEHHPWEREQNEYPTEAMARAQAQWLVDHWSYPIAEIEIYEHEALIVALAVEPIP